MRKSTLVILVSALLFLFFFGYWFKYQMEIDFIKTFSLANYLPIQFLKKNVDTADNIVFPTEAGDLLNDSFESKRSTDNWWKLWMREKRKVTQGYDLNGVSNSHCLLIKSNSEKDWSYQYNKLIKVKEGDIFNFEGFVKAQDESIGASLSVVLYDENRKVIQWHYAKEDVRETGGWVKVKRGFIVPKGVEYIRFRLTGFGKGKFWFDNIRISKIP